jgi:hypothetical protein
VSGVRTRKVKQGCPKCECTRAHPPRRWCRRSRRPSKRRSRREQPTLRRPTRCALGVLARGSERRWEGPKRVESRRERERERESQMPRRADRCVSEFPHPSQPRERLPPFTSAPASAYPKGSRVVLAEPLHRQPCGRGPHQGRSQGREAHGPRGGAHARGEADEARVVEQPDVGGAQEPEHAE